MRVVAIAFLIGAAIPDSLPSKKTQADSMLHNEHTREREREREGGGKRERERERDICIY